MRRLFGTLGRILLCLLVCTLILLLRLAGTPWRRRNRS